MKSRILVGSLWVAAGSCMGFSGHLSGCPIVLPIAPNMQTPTTPSETSARDLSLFMLKGLVSSSSASVADYGSTWTLDCAAVPESIQDPIKEVVGPDGFMDWRQLRTVFETNFLQTTPQRGQSDIIKRDVRGLVAATSFDRWSSRMVNFSAVKRKSRRIFRSPTEVVPPVSVSQTLDSEVGDPSAAILETEVAIKRRDGLDWDFYSYNRAGELVNYSTFPSGEGPSPRMCLSCHYSAASRSISRFLP